MREGHGGGDGLLRCMSTDVMARSDRLFPARSRWKLSRDHAAQLRATLQQFAQPKSAVSHPLRRPKAVWLLPQLQAEVAYSNVTADGMLRHGVLKGLRHDLKD